MGLSRQQPAVNLDYERGYPTFVGDADILNQRNAVADTTGGPVTLTLPLIPLRAGPIRFKNVGNVGNILTIAAAAGNTIDGFATLLLTDGQSALIVGPERGSGGVDWKNIAGLGFGVCCPPIVGDVSVLDPDGVSLIFERGAVDISAVPPNPALVIQFGTFKMDDIGAGGSVRIDRYGAPVPSAVAPPVVAGPVVVAGAPGFLDSCRVAIDTATVPPPIGQFWELVFTNACGCCTRYTLGSAVV